MKYTNVIDYLNNYIQEKHLTDGSRLPSENEISAALGISRITVRRALQVMVEAGTVYKIQGSGTFYQAPTHAAVLSPSCEMCYIPMILPDEQDTYTTMELIRGAESFLSDMSCSLSLHFSHGNPAHERLILQKLAERGCRCIIVFPCTAECNGDLCFQLIQQGVHIVFIDRIPQNVTSSLITADHRLGGYIAGSHLAENGYRNMAVISVKPATEAGAVMERISGFRIALQEHGLHLSSDMICFTSPEHLEQQLHSILELPSPPDAVLCLNDLAAVPAVNYLQRCGLRIPEDIAVASFDNLPITSSLNIPITEVTQPFFRIGYEAAQTAHSLLTGKLDYHVHKILPMALLPRHSTATVHQHG